MSVRDDPIRAAIVARLAWNAGKHEDVDGEKTQEQLHRAKGRKFVYLVVRFRALILSLCTLFYLVEYAATPRAMAHRVHECCQERTAKGKPVKGCNPMNDCCLNCPLCYVMLLPASPERVAIAATVREYFAPSSTYVYLYHASCWKPPNAA